MTMRAYSGIMATMGRKPQTMTPVVFWSRVKRGQAHECWPYMPERPGYTYGHFKQNGRQTLAHRYAYEITNGAILPGAVLHHTCENPRCVNPGHLSMTTHTRHRRHHADQITHCPQGHEYSPENTRYKTDGSRECRTCNRARNNTPQARAAQRRWQSSARGRALHRERQRRYVARKKGGPE